MLVATYSHASPQNGKGAVLGGKSTSNVEIEKGLLTLMSSDSPGIEVFFSRISRFYYLQVIQEVARKH